MINLVGHEHYDRFGKSKNGILTMVVNNSSGGAQWSDSNPREKSAYDTFNVCGVDPNCGVIKIIKIGTVVDHYLRPRNVLTYDYIHDKVITNY